MTAKQLSSYCYAIKYYMDIEIPSSSPETEKTHEIESPVFIEKILTPEVVTDLRKEVFLLTGKNKGSTEDRWREKTKGFEDFVRAVFTLPTIFEAECTLENIKKAMGHNNGLNQNERNALKDNKIIALQELSESLGMLSKYLIDNCSQEKELEIFWKIFESYGLEKEMLPTFEGIRAGIIGQSASYHLIKSLGLNCSLAHPDEDAFQGTDFIISNSGRAPDIGRLQVKHKHESDGVEMINVKSYDPTFAVETELDTANGRHLAHFIPDESFNNLKNSCSPDEFAFYLELPDKNPNGSLAINNISGIPSETLIKNFKVESDRVLKNIFALQ